MNFKNYFKLHQESKLQIIEEGGLGGHMSHVYEALSPEDVFEFFDELLNGKLELSEKVDGCLDKDTLITTKEYGEISIGDIVDNKIKCNVLSYNISKGKTEWDEIISFQTSTKSDDKQWYILTMTDGTELKLTGNHHIWDENTKKYIAIEDIDDISKIDLLTL